jgi:hypothetical protein
MATDVQIANKALIQLGVRPTIADLQSDTSAEARTLNALYDSVKRTAIRKYRPNCCVARAVLSQDQDYKPCWGFESGYKYPQNMVKLLEVNNKTHNPDDCPIEGQWILSHNRKAEVGETATKMQIKYLCDKKTELLDDDFATLLSYELAFASAPVINQAREAMAKALLDQYANRWAADNAMENGFTVEEYDPLFDTIRTTRE